MWSRRTVASLVALLAGCAGIAALEQDVERRAGAALERRDLGTEALQVIDNILRHGPPAPPATPPLVPELLARPLAAMDAARIFRETAPPPLAALEAAPSKARFEDLLQTYLAELAEAQRLLRAATRVFVEEPFEQGLPVARHLLGAAEATDAAQLRRANLAFVAATVKFASSIRAATDPPSQPRTFQSPIGTVVIGTTGDDRHGPDAALIIDPGGDDVYERAPLRGGSVSVIVDLAGKDQYGGSDVVLRGLSAIVDLAGDDRYSMESGLGAALVGASLLIDFAGDDSYTARHFAQGAAALGIGALVDLAGNDRYRVEAWGQGFGMAGGAGVLWDQRGNDHYSAGGVPDPFGRGSGLSGAQGAAFGYRGRIAGGVGILRDDAGDDVYEAQMFAQGTGYYYGLGVLWDRGGADRYEAFRYAQGCGVHQALGVLRDEAGDDRYAIASIYGQGMGLDVAVGVLLDAAGSDSYGAQALAQGAATANGFGLLADEGGGDRFALADGQHAWGRAEWLRGLPSVALLLHGNASFTRNGQPVPAPPENPPVAVQPASGYTCPSTDPGEAMLCRVRDAQDLEKTWAELKSILAADPATPLAGWIALALARRPPRDAEEIAALLDKNASCNVRALALRAWPTLDAAAAGLRSDCFRLQAAARAAFVRLGVQPPAEVPLPLFLRRIPPQADTF